MIHLRLGTGETVQVTASDIIDAFIDTTRDREDTINPVALQVAQSVKQPGEGQLITCLRESLYKLGVGIVGQADSSSKTLEK